MDEELRNMSQHDARSSIDEKNRILCEALTYATKRQLVSEEFFPKRPWISNHTIDFITQRHGARIVGNRILEHELNSIIKENVKVDRKRWLQSLAGSHDWNKLKQLKIPRSLRKAGSKL